jgi:hypothetical protein
MKDLQFMALVDPAREDCETLSRLQPRNPFCTGAYLAARAAAGAVWLLGVRRQGELIAGCGALLAAGRLNRSLEIESFPMLGPTAGVFTDGLAAFCNARAISRLSLNTFGSPAGCVIPLFPGERARLPRREFLLDLQAPDLWAGLASNHKRRIKAAEKAGVAIRAAGAAAVVAHVALMQETFERRRQRGEAVPEQIDSAPLEAYVAGGAARVYQAWLGGRVVSSILILLSPSGGYYQSAGNSPESLSMGASHLLVYRAAQMLQSESIEIFNLGGVSEENPGLVRFKEGFGAQGVELEAAEFDVGPSWKTAVTSMAALVSRAVRRG